ncbi:MAG TPA: histidine phosphatase family protein [Niabella sp.]|nr:histidine phosphatase family protein [Niabella sp.]
MKHLIIIRHAKAVQHLFGNDIDRSITDKGEKNALLMAKRLLNEGYKINKFFSSPALRTKQTTAIFAQVHGVEETNIRYFDKLYLGDTLEFNETISWIKQNVDTLAIVAHKPGVTNFTNDSTHSHISSLPTSGIAIVELDINDWADFEMAPKKLIKVLTPND